MNYLRITGALCLTCLAGALVVCSEAFYQLLEQTKKSEVTLCDDISRVQADLSDTKQLLDRQLSRFNSTLDKTSGGLLGQTKLIQSSLSQTLAGVNGLTDAANKTLASADASMKSVNAVVSDPNIPASLRDVRINLALAGVTMSHIRKIADVGASTAPAVAKSVERVSEAAAGISEDVHLITSDVTKPKKWYVKAYDFSRDFANLLRWIP